MHLPKISKVFGAGGGRLSMSSVLILLSASLAVTSSQNVEFQFREEQDPSAYVGNFAMEAQRAGILSQEDFSRLRFSIYSSEYFTINETTGAVTTTKTIDREKMCPGKRKCEREVEVTIYKRDSSDNLDLYKILKFVVIVQDINDNAPTFRSPKVSLSISEGNAIGDVLRTSGAVDEDTGDGNSVKQYSFLDSTNIFSLSVIQNPDGSSYLGIVVEEVLDREIRDFYQVTVLATDGGFPQKSGQVIIDIKVTDANDNPPEFLKNSYNESVMENVDLITPIMRVEAEDIDDGRNAEISYRFSSQVSEKIRQKLYVDEQTGEIFAHSAIDYEENKLFQFVIEAADHGLPQYTSRVGVTLHVIDVNDNSPQININLAPTGTDISELEPVGKFIAHVSVQDRDEGINKIVLCDIDDEYFSLDKFDNYESNMYKVTLLKPLDHELFARHRVIITCTDSGSPPRSNTSSFVVNVIDENDNRPAFSEPVYYGDILENKGGEIQVAIVKAYDPDGGNYGKVTYSIEDKYNGLFRINSTSGVISVFGPLDREVTSTYEFHVIARDQSLERLSSSSLTIITVLDENDEAPIFLRPIYFGDVLENQPSGTLVGNVTAIDKDDATNARMKYSILAEDSRDGDYFSINAKNGIIKSKTMFDREQKSHYNFRVRVIDPTNPGFFDTCNFTVRILDDNDHSPVIKIKPGENASYVVDIATDIGYTVTNIEAFDADSKDSKHSQLVYKIDEGDPNQLFNLNRFTGSLTIGRYIRSKDPKSYHLVIRVEDGGDPPRFDILDVFVTINGTIPVAKVSKSGIDQNILIVVILIGVTIVLGLAIMTTICLVKKIDRERRRNHHGMNANGGLKKGGKNFEDKMYHIKQEEIFTRGAIDITAVDDANGNSRKNGNNSSSKKEVSFSFDEESDSHNTSAGSGQPLTTSSFRSGGDKVKQNGHYGGTSNPRAGGNRIVNDMNIPAEHPEKPGGGGGVQRHPSQDEESHLIAMVRKTGEDALSQSSGESDPSDSGRGGSEDDSSNRGSGIDPEQINGLYAPMSYHRGSKSADNHHHHPHQQQQQQQHPHHRYPSRGSGRHGGGLSHKGRQLNRLSPLNQISPRDSFCSDVDSDILSMSGSRTTQSTRTDSERSTNPILPAIAGVLRHHQPQTNEITPYRGSRDNIHRWNSSNNTTSSGGGNARDSPHRLSAPYNNNISSSHNNILRSFHSQPNGSSSGHHHNHNRNNNNNNNHHHSQQNVSNNTNNRDPNTIMGSFSMERLPPAHHHHHHNNNNNNTSTDSRSRSTTPSDRPPRYHHRNSDHFGPSPGDRRLTAMSLAEEDDRTTTSGSYSINTDERRQEIDELILHDSVV